MLLFLKDVRAVARRIRKAWTLEVLQVQKTVKKRKYCNLKLDI